MFFVIGNQLNQSRTSDHKSGSSFHWLALLVGVLLASPTPVRAAATPVLTNVAQVRALSPDQARERLPVSLQAVVTFSEPSGWMLFVQDHTDGIYVGYSNKTAAIVPGDRVEITGFSHPGSFNTCIAEAKVGLVDHPGTPAPRRVAISELMKGTEDSRWVQVTGVVRRVDFQADRVVTDLDVEGHRVPVAILDYQDRRTNDLTPDAVVSVQGVCGVVLGAGRTVSGAQLFVPSLANNLILVEAPLRPSFTSAPRTAAEVAMQADQPGLKRRTWMRGRLKTPGDEVVTVEDPTGVVAAQTIFPSLAREGELVAASGFAVRSNGVTTLQDAEVRVLTPTLEQIKAGQTNENDPTILAGFSLMVNRADQLRSLSFSAASRGMPARTRVRVVFADPVWNRACVHDGTSPLTVIPPVGNSQLGFGQWVELEGFTTNSELGRVLNATRVQVLDTNIVLPPAQSVGMADILSNRWLGQRVRVNGYLHTVTNVGQHLLLEIRLDGGYVTAQVPNVDQAASAGITEGLETWAEGVLASSRWSRRFGGQYTSLLVQRISDIGGTPTPMAGVFSLPTQTATNIHRLPREGQANIRVKAKGVAMAQHVGESIFLHDGTDALFVGTIQNTIVRPGQVVEVVGWPAANAWAPELEDAVFRLTGETAPLPQPTKVDARQAMSGLHDAEMVEIEGRLARHTTQNGRACMVIKSDWTLFDAVLDGHDPAGRLKSIKPDSWVRLTGVCSVLTSSEAAHTKPDSFFIHLRSPEDVVQVEGPPWWSRRSAMVLSGGMSALVLLILVWAIFLRRHLLGQRRLLGEKARQEQVLSEFGYRLSSAVTPLAAARVIADTLDRLLGWDAFSFDLYSGETCQVQSVLLIDLIDGKRQEVPCSDVVTEPSGRFKHALDQGAYLFRPGKSDLRSQPFGDINRRSACVLYAPIRKGAEVLGLVSIHSYKPDAFQDEHVRLLQSAADHCAETLERIRAEEVLRRANEDLERRVAERTLANAQLKLEIAERQQAEAALRQAESEMEKLASFPRFNPNPVLEFSATGRLTYYNDAARNLAVELKREHPAEILPPGIETIVSTCLQTNQSRQRVELVVEGRTISWSFFPIRAAGTVHCYAGDITERLNLEAQLRQAQKMESIGRLAGGVAHDFNNLLTVIQGHAGLLQTFGAGAPRILESARQIETAADRAAELTRQLLTFSRKQPMRLKMVDLNAVLGSVSGMLGRLIGEDITVNVEFSPQRPVVMADSGMLEQVVLNLAVNARDAMPGGGQLTLALAVNDLDAPELARHPKGRLGRFACLSVLDTGCGMSQETLEHIFEPFFTTKDVGKGTGLGLATVFGIVEQHHGWIEVMSAPGKGSAFHVYLPVSETVDSMPSPQAQARAEKGGSEMVLIVEDEPAVRDLVSNILKQFGYAVIEVGSGPAAMEVWKSRKDQIDLLLTDVVMPEGISGIELARHFQEQKPGLKTILSTGYSVEMPLDQLQPGTVLLTKPYEVRTLINTVRECLDAE